MIQIQTNYMTTLKNTNPATCPAHDTRLAYSLRPNYQSVSLRLKKKKKAHSVGHNIAPLPYPAASHIQESKGMSQVCSKTVQMGSLAYHSNKHWSAHHIHTPGGAGIPILL